MGNFAENLNLGNRFRPPLHSFIQFIWQKQTNTRNIPYIIHIKTPAYNTIHHRKNIKG